MEKNFIMYMRLYNAKELYNIDEIIQYKRTL